MSENRGIINLQQSNGEMSVLPDVPPLYAMMFILSPAIRLIARVNFRRKLLTLGLLIMIPLLVLGLLVWDRAQQQVNRMLTARSSLPIQLALLDLNLAVQAHAVDALRPVDQSSSLIPQRKAVVAALDATTSAIKQTRGDETVTASLGELRKAWEAVADGAASSRKDIVQSHLAIGERIALLADAVADSSELRLLGERDSLELAAAVSPRLPALAVSLSFAGNAGYAAILEQRLPSATRQSLAIARGRIDSGLDWLVADVQKIAARHPQVGKNIEPVVAQLNDAVLGLQEYLVTKVMDTTDYDVAPSDYLARSEKVTTALHLLSRTVIQSLDGILGARLAELQNRQLLLTTMILGIVLALSYVLAAAYFAITQPLRRLAAASAAMASGDLRVRIKVDSRDELAEVAATFNNMADSFERVIDSVNQAVSGVLVAAKQLAAKGEAVRLASERQHSAAERTASAVQELTASIAEIASSADETSGVALLARNHTEIGREHAQLAVSRMGDTSKSVHAATDVVQSLYQRSESINAMLLTIKGIAGQTNLLALNAAIEAARAGDAGRGFAVVADEVRKLADMTNQATHQIGGIIRDIKDETQQTAAIMSSNERYAVLSTEALDGLAQALATITREVDRAASHVQTIAGGTRAQQTSSALIAQNMEEVALMAEENRIHAHETATAIDRLKELAERLGSVVTNLKTSRGRIDQAFEPRVQFR